MDACGNTNTACEGGEETASAEQEEYYCQPCLHEGESRKAHVYCTDCPEYLCSDCHKTHAKLKPADGHVVIDVSELPRVGRAAPEVQRGGQAGPEGPRDDTVTAPCQTHDSRPCPTHGDRLEQYYCGSHQVAACTVCVTLYHRTCPDVRHIRDAASGHARSNCEEARHKLQELTDRLTNISTDPAGTLGTVRELDVAHSRALHTYRDELVASVDRWAAEAEARKDEYVHVRRRQLAEVRRSSEEQRRRLQAVEADISEHILTGNNSALFVAMHRATEVINECKETIPTLENDLNS